MYCKNIDACFAEINAYCAGENTGRVLLVNTENYTMYQKIKEKLEADGSKICVYVSESCPENELPKLEEILEQIVGENDYVLIGYSQAGMLRSAAYIDKMIGTLLELPVSGHAVILLDHCEQYLKSYFSLHPDIEKRIILVAGDASSMPKIRLTIDAKECVGIDTIPNMKQLFVYFEKLTDILLGQRPEVTVVTKYTPELFKDAIYSVTACDDIYSIIKKQYSEIAAGTERRFGTDKQWRYLAEQLGKYKNLSSVAKNVFGSTENMQFYLGEVIDEGNDDKRWLLWLCMKVFNSKSNKYLHLVMENSQRYDDFDEHVFLDLVKLHREDKDFRQCYTERKRLLDIIPENIGLLDTYCSKIGVYQRDSVFYLTDSSEKEELAFLQCLEKYEYTRNDLQEITDIAFKLVSDYLKRFSFNVTNTKVPVGEENLRDILTEYFEEYKFQKLTNHIESEFIKKVETYAEERPYNKLQARTSIVSKMEKSGAQLYFFDALGVEYLGFIQARCEKYGIIPEISIAHCELPSITEKNKDFLHFFNDQALDIKELDELKHHSQIVDYEQCKEPIHLFRELQIIDEELKKIESRLKQGKCNNAIIVSDHGASRLAVIFEQENEKLELEEKGLHSGRCCPAKSDPCIPYVSYWDGFAVLANYERFKGGRRANVEVHGGASLEEVVIPIISLTKKPADIDVCFVNPVITLKGKEPTSIIVYANIPLQQPKLMVNEKIYDGEFMEDSKHAMFIMPEMRRTKDYIADLFDGDKKIASGLEFHVQKNTQEQQLFKKSLL